MIGFWRLLFYENCTISYHLMAILKYFKLLGEDSHLSELLKYRTMSVYIFLADANRRECTDGGHTKMA